MAGNIIPAIATTNAVISGLVVMQAFKILQQKHESATLVNLQKVPEQPLKATKPFAPNESCAVCRDVYVTARVSPSATLGTVLERVQAWLAPSLGDDVLEASVLEGTRVLADPDFEDNLGRTLADLGVGRGATLTLIDEDDKYRPIHVCVLEGEGEGEGEEEIVLPDQPPALALRPAKAASESDSDDSDFEVVEQDNDNETETSKKRAAENDGEERDGKKRKVESESDPVVIDDDEDYFEILP
jgi:ubiquitin-like 1-activating enzyme E1 B